MGTSLLSGDGVQEVRRVLQGLLSVENEVRLAHEKELEERWVSRPGELLPALCGVMMGTVMGGGVNAATATTISAEILAVGCLAAVLFRRLVGRVVQKGAKGETIRLWNRLQGEAQEGCCAILLEMLCRPDVPREMRNKIGDAVAEVARIRTIHEGWPQLTHLLWNMDRTQIAIGLRIIEAVPELVEEQPATAIATALLRVVDEGMQEVMGKGGAMANAETIQTWLAAIKALHSIMTTTSDERKQAYLPLIERLVLILRMMHADQEALSGALQTTVQLVEDCPKLFRKNHLALLKELTMSLSKPTTGGGEEEELTSEVQSLMVELIVTLCEVLPTLIRKQDDLITTLCVLLLERIARLSDSQEWYQVSPEDDLEEEEASLEAEQAISRVAIALGGRILLPRLLGGGGGGGIIQEMQRSANWKHRHAALKATANFAEGCAELLVDRLGELLALLWPAFQDPHPRVQYAACHALGQLCTDFSGTLQEQHALPSLQALATLLSTSAHPRVQAHAAAAMINFAEGVDAAAIAPLLDPLIERLVSLLSTTTLYLQEQVISTIAAFSAAAGHLFTKYHHAIMPMLMNCLTENLPNTYRLLQCRALDAATLIGLAVGKEAFASYTQPLLTLMVSLQQANLEADDKMLEYLPVAWLRMCQVLGKDFAPFMSLIMPGLLSDAAAEPDVAVLDAADAAAEEDYDPDEWEFGTVRGRRLGIRTATLDTKCAAVENLVVYVQALGAHFFPFAEQTFNTVLPLVKFELHEGVQCAAMDLLASLLKSLYEAHPEQVEAMSGMASQIINEILAQLSRENDADFISAALDALGEIMEVGGMGAGGMPILMPVDLPMRIFGRIDQLITMLMRASSRRLQSKVPGGMAGMGQDRANNAKDGDDNEEEEDEEEEDDDSIMYAITRLAATLFKRYGEAALPHAKNLLQFCQRVILHNRPVIFKHAALCVIDDLVQHLGAKTAPLAESIVECVGRTLEEQRQLLLQPASEGERDVDVMRAAVFGVGTCAEKGGALYQSFCMQTLPHLLALIEHPEAKAPSTVILTDNVMSSVARICQSFPSSIDLATVVPRWLTGLPVTHDHDEVSTVYGWLLHLLRTNPALLLTQSNGGALLLRSILDVLVTPDIVLEEALRRDLCSAQLALRQQLAQETVLSITSSYTPEQLLKIS